MPTSRESSQVASFQHLNVRLTDTPAQREARSDEIPLMKRGRLKSVSQWAGVILLISFAACRQFESISTGVRIRFADDQTAIFEQMRSMVEGSDAAKAADYLSYTLDYYPSGTKQAAGSPLDRVVERARRSALREMIALLRTKTGQDFGDEPRRWIEELRRPKAR
jgi:hypothetical protein